MIKTIKNITRVKNCAGIIMWEFVRGLGGLCNIMVTIKVRVMVVSSNRSSC